VLLGGRFSLLLVLARCGKYLVVTALVLSMGLHRAALQTVAWTTMLAGNLCCDSFSCAVCKTFDGQHPCCLCKAIAAAKAAQKKSEATLLSLKMEFPPLARKPELFPPSQFALLPLNDLFAESLSTVPPVPPPRSFCV
jgi:hypothetical protein